MNKNDFKKCIILPFIFLFFGVNSAQEIYVGNSSVMLINGNVLSDHVITSSPSATVIMTGATTFTGDGFVDGTITVKNDGVTNVPIGDDGVKSIVNMTTATTDFIKTTYIASAATGTMDAALASYALSDAEYWSIVQTSGASADVAVTGLVNTASTYGGEGPIGPPILVRRDNTSSNWVTYSSNPGFGEFAFAAETASLGIETFDTSQFSVFPNPLNTNNTSIQFNLPSSVKQLDVVLYDIAGKVVQQYINVPVQSGVNDIKKPQVAQGIYLAQFSFNNGEQRIMKKLIIQ